MIPKHVNAQVASVVLAAKERGMTLSIDKVARQLANAAGCPDRVKEIGDALIREGIRQRIAMELGGSRRAA